MLKKILFIILLTLNLGHVNAQESNKSNDDCFNCYKCSSSSDANNKESNSNNMNNSNSNKQHNHNNKKVEKRGFFERSIDYSSVLPMLIFTNSF